jgi:hypothetical protein
MPFSGIFGAFDSFVAIVAADCWQKINFARAFTDWPFGIAKPVDLH